jgi:ribonuclease-3
MTAEQHDTAGRIGCIETQIGYRFRVPLLLEEALTHSSLTGGGNGRHASNERLEFLGDRVLGLAIATILHGRFPDETVGDLARRHTALVRREALFQIAKTLGLPACIRMSKGEEDAGGRRNPGLLADACEALLAAIYLDGGFEAALGFVQRVWQPSIEELLRPPKDAKTELQEWVQAKGMSLPAYHETERVGPPHAPTFCVELALPGYVPVRASGLSKRSAEQAAAEAMLAQLRKARP